MRIAILGTRGIPANYGGFETFAEELGTRLAARGHAVTVYCRKSNQPNPMTEYRSVKLVTLPSVHTKSLDTLSHTFLSALHFLTKGGDIAFFCNSGNGAFLWMPRLRGAKVVMNPDGKEWERAKWGGAAKLFFKFSEYLTAWFPHLVVSDSRVIREYYKQKFGRDSEFVAYGADLVERGFGREHLEPLGVRPDEYFLFVSRLEPENNAHVLVKAFEQVKTDKKLLVVGSAPFADEYIRALKSTGDPRIVFPGGLYGDIYKALRANAYVYVNAMEVGGTHPAILEAMGAGNCVLVSDISYNEEAVGEAGVTFTNKSVDDLRDKMQYLVEHPEEVQRYRERAVERVSREYSWQGVVDAYERLFRSLLTEPQLADTR